MNDYGVFQAIQSLIEKDEFLRPRITALVTEARPGLNEPYVHMHVSHSEADIPCMPQVVLVTCELEVISTYHGDQEIQELMSRLDFRLQGGILRVSIPGLNASGLAMVKLMDQSQQRTSEGRRVGKLTYQIKINIRRK